MSAYLQATLARVWSPVGQTPSVRVNPQRECLHFYGGLDVVSGRQVALSLPKLDGENTIVFLEQVMQQFSGQPILILWDRATWHKGKVREFVEQHPCLEMLYLPPGCPDLNPQEHVWKQTRAAVGHGYDYPHLAALRQAFQSYLEQTRFHFQWITKYLPATFYVSVSI